LEEAWNAESGRDEDDAEGWGWSDEEVLLQRHKAEYSAVTENNLMLWFKRPTFWYTPGSFPDGPREERPHVFRSSWSSLSSPSTLLAGLAL